MIESTELNERLRGAAVRGSVPIPNSDPGILFDNGIVLDVRHGKLLSDAASAEVVMVARRVLARAAAQLESLTELQSQYPAREEDLEVPEFIPAVPILLADARERDEARKLRTIIDSLEVGEDE